MLNEFRQDLVSGEWVLLATGRAKRPGSEGPRLPFITPKETCPFEEPEKNSNEVLITYHSQIEGSTDWFAKVAKNKYPAVIEGEAGPRIEVGPFITSDAKGLHEIVVYRDHIRDLHEFSKEELGRVFRIYQERYQAMASYSASKYVLIFHNRGAAAGASISHPHSQIISIPIMPPDIKRSIKGSEDYYEQNNKRVYDLMLDWEIAEQKRIIFSNHHFIAFCPFVSKTPYEIRIFSKESHAHFDQMPIELLPELGEVMGSVLRRMHKGLNDPDYNFFIHTAPIESRTKNVHEFYSWHIEIVPKMKIEGAFEIGSGVEVNVVDPDEAALLLRQAE